MLSGCFQHLILVNLHRNYRIQTFAASYLSCNRFAYLRAAYHLYICTFTPAVLMPKKKTGILGVAIAAMPLKIITIYEVTVNTILLTGSDHRGPPLYPARHRQLSIVFVVIISILF